VNFARLAGFQGRMLFQICGKFMSVSEYVNFISTHIQLKGIPNMRKYSFDGKRVSRAGFLITLAS
jgi:hypothetical protein